MIPVKRKEDILDFIQQNRLCSIQELASHFSVSRVTIHRVLNDLEGEALVTKVHGGVRALELHGGIETRFAIRLKTNTAKKIEIARKALELVQEGDTIFIDSSTTCCQFARLLGAQVSSHVTVISNSPLISYELSNARHINLISTGGEFFQEVYAFAGDIALEVIGKLQFGKAFVSAAALSLEQGLMTTQSYLALIKRRVIEKASEVNLLIDSTKFERLAPRVFAPVTRVTRIVTDSGLSDNSRDRYGSVGVELVL